MAEDPKKKEDKSKSTGDPPWTTGGGGKIDEHPLAKKLHATEGDHKRLVTLSGYPGRSGIPDHIRLYLHHDFQSYYEIKLADIHHSWPPIHTETTDPIHVAIDAEAKPHLVVHTTVSSTAASFLKGNLVSSYLASTIESATIVHPLDLTGVPPPPPHGGIIFEPILHHRHKGPKPPE
jgi:hypothetical protein